MWLRQNAPVPFRPATELGVVMSHRNTLEPVRVFAFDLVDGRYDLVADATGELISNEPFEIELPIRDITP
jgi:hypothetical protein